MTQLAMTAMDNKNLFSNYCLGLFDPKKNPELEKWEIGDSYFSEAIDLISRSRADGGKAVGFAMVILQKRMVSSLFSITKSLEKRAMRLREELRKREQALEAIKELNEYEREYEDLEDERIEEIEDHLLALTTAEHPKEMQIEIRQLEGLVEDAKKIPKDTKAKKFLEFVNMLDSLLLTLKPRECPRVSASSVQSAFHRRSSAFIRVHLRLIIVSLSDRIRKIQFELFPIINENGQTESLQSMQSSSIPVTKYEKATAARFGTRMTQMTQIFTDKCDPYSNVIPLHFEV